MILPTEFYLKNTSQAARELLGKILVHELAGGTTEGLIVETEAYLMENDPACHTSRGPTKRNREMFGPSGRAYVYLIYGIHYCFNAVTGKKGVGEAVLLRALRPIQGIDLMKSRRGPDIPEKRLASGPGNLCRAMGINKAHNGISLIKPPLYIKSNNHEYAGNIISSPRIGITKAKDLMLRFYLEEESDYVSGR